MRQRRCRPWLGTFVEIEADCAVAIEAAFKAVARVHLLMSAHEPDSELSRLNRSTGGAPVRLSQDTRTVLDRALFWARQSDGAFDPVAAGHNAVARGDIPLHDGQRALDPSADFEALMMEEEFARLDRIGCIDLGGIAKGHAVDVAVAALRKVGMTDGMVNAGGDLFAFGEPRRVVVPDPMNGAARFTLMLRDRAVATSAGQRGDGGLDFAHLPRRRADHVSVTVEAPRAIDADALTKIAFARHPHLPRLLALADARAIAITASGEVVELAGERLAA